MIKINCKKKERDDCETIMKKKNRTFTKFFSMIFITNRTLTIEVTDVPERMATFCFKIISLRFCASDLNFFLKESSFNSLQKYLFSLM